MEGWIIGVDCVYVDQLEERLASFSMARRDIEAREERCKDLEIKIGGHTNEIQLLKTHLESVSKEREEVKDGVITTAVVTENSI